MSNSTTLIDTISSSAANKELTANGNFDAGSPAMIWGRRASTTNLLTWGYYGGWYNGAQVSNGTLTLSASATNYVYANASTGAVSVNQTGFPANVIQLYTIVTSATTVTSYTDQRAYSPQLPGTGSVSSVGATGGAETDQTSGGNITSTGNIRTTLKLAGGAVQTSAYTIATTDRGCALVINNASAETQVLPTPTGTTGNFPAGWWMEVDNIGAGLATVSVPTGETLDGVTNGTWPVSQNQGGKVFTDGTNWFSIRGGGSGGGGGSSTLAGLTDVNVSEGSGIDGNALVWQNSTSKWIARSIGATFSGFHGAQLSAASAATAVSGATTAVSFNTSVSYDSDGFFATGQPTRLTVPTGKGMKKVSVQGQANFTTWGTGTNGCQLGIRKNGTTIVAQDCKAPGRTGAVSFQIEADAVPVADGDYFELVYLQSDNTAAASVTGTFTIVAVDGGLLHQMIGFYPGVPTGSAKLLSATTPSPVTLPAGLAGSYAYCDSGTTATAAVTLTIKQVTSGGVATNIGTINFAIGATAGTFTFASAVTTAAGDRIQVVNQSSADATFGNVDLAIVGSR
jgi:hypothetical protein